MAATGRRRTSAEKDYIARPPKWLLKLAENNPMVLFSEAHWQREVIGAMRLFGFTLIYHTHDSRRSDPGLPDLIAWKPGRLLVWELKREDKQATPAQLAWLAAFEERGAETGVYRPSQWDEVLKCLQG